MELDIHISKDLSEDKQMLIYKHLELVICENKITNLTRISTIEDAKILHVEDSLSALPEFNMAKEGMYGDLGTGGGYPGIPLAIATNRQTVLIESVSKKAAIITRIIEELKLESKISIFNGRIEEYTLQERNSFSVLTARALSSLPSLLELAAPLLKLGGILICYKSQVSDDEYHAAEALREILGMYLDSDRSFLLSDNKTARRILVYQKRHEETLTLPRRTGVAQKRFLKA